jgi:DNA-binding GntR family transcriptional regulator
VPLSEELGVSRGPIREALRSLESEGLVQITPRRGAVVVSLSKADFLDAYQVREALEALGVRLAVPILSAAALDDLDDQLAIMTEHAAAGDVDAFFESNARFHEAFVVASGNRKLVEAYRRLMAQMGPYRRPSARLRGNVERSIAEHRKIVVAARRRDVDAAVSQLMKHIEVPQRMLERMSDEEFARTVTGISIP